MNKYSTLYNITKENTGEGKGRTLTLTVQSASESCKKLHQTDY